jgi:hypothetical protein
MEKENTNVSLGKGIIVSVNDRKVLVKKLGLIKYVAMTRTVKSLISVGLELLRKLLKFQNGPTNDEDEIPMEQRANFIAELLTDTLEKNLMEIIKLIDLCVDDLEFEYICDEVGLEDAIELLKAIVEVNKLEKLGEEIKNLLRDLPVGM